MINFVPIFPLALVVYPGEALNLHIFEPRYKQLITDCFADSKPFGIPVVLKNGIAEMGVLVEITEIVQVYDDGKMDIKTKGLEVFSILEITGEIPHKLYNGAVVNYPSNDIKPKPFIAFKILDSVYILHRLLNVSKHFKKNVSELLSYDIAHHSGLSLEQEYEVLALCKEEERLEYLRRHLEKVIPVVAGMEQLKQKIELNGHFKQVKGYNFNS